MNNLHRNTESKNRNIEFVCNYIDDEWLDIIGTNGVRVSIPAVLVKSEILPDDVVSIEVKRDEIKTALRRQGKLSLFNFHALSSPKNTAESINEKKVTFCAKQSGLSNVIYLRDKNVETEPSTSYSSTTYPMTDTRLDEKDCALSEE